MLEKEFENINSLSLKDLYDSDTILKTCTCKYSTGETDPYCRFCGGRGYLDIDDN